MNREKQRNGKLADGLDRMFKYFALAPALILLVFVAVLPAVNLLRMSVSNVDFVRGRSVWAFIGTANLLKLFSDWLFLTALRNTLVFVVAAVSVEMVLGFFLAMLASQLSTGKGLYRTMVMLPILVPAIAIGSMWSLLYNYEFGFINRSIVALGGRGIPWLGSTDFAMLSVIIVDIWHWVPFVFLICLAGFESLPVDVLEAASVEGAGRWSSLRFIILPLMWPTVLVALMFRTIFAFNVFDEIFLLTRGGPGASTEVVSLYIFKVFFEQNRLGYGAMISVFTIFIILVIMLGYQQVGRKRSNS